MPGCDARGGPHAHHLIHWEDGGPTELANLTLLCPHHHRAHQRGVITVRGPAPHLEVLDQRHRPLPRGSLARKPSRPPKPARYEHPLGERIDWKWYDPPSIN